MALEISPVRGFSDLRAFVRLPERLHAGTPWIIQLRLERYAYLSRHLNPFFKDGEAEYFLARRDGRVVGRISAHISGPLNRHQNASWGLFGFLDFEQDQEVLDGLLAAAEQWLRERGCDRLIGPFSFVPNDEIGVLIHGYELEPMIRQGWNPPYYREMLEAAGLAKAVDVFHWQVGISDRSEARMNPMLPKIAEESREKYGFKVRRITRASLWRDLDDFIKIYNAAWSKNWGFVPYTQEDKPQLWLDYQLVIDSDWFMLVETPEGETVAMATTVPDPNQYQERMHGRLLPFGWWYLVNAKRYIDRVRVGFLGVLPEYQHTGAGALLYLEHYNTAHPNTRITTGEAGWVLETNRSMNHGLEAMGGHISKVYRVYERTFDPAAEPAAPPARIRRYKPPESVLPVKLD